MSLVVYLVNIAYFEYISTAMPAVCILSILSITMYVVCILSILSTPISTQSIFRL